MTRFNEIRVGDEAKIKHRISKDDIDRFVELTGDTNPVHVNEEYAGRTEVRRPVAHGMLSASFISTVIGTRLPGDGALWYAQNLEFLMPVRAGDEITVCAKVLKKNEKDRSLEIQTDIFNQDRQKVTRGVSKVRVLREKTSPAAGIMRGQKKLALIIGSSGGIGGAVAGRLARNGFDVALHYHKNKASAQSASKVVRTLGRKACLLCADLTDAAQVQGMVEEARNALGGLTVLVNCATARVPKIAYADLEWQDFERHWGLQVRGSWHAVRAAVTCMEKEGGGSIIHLSTQYTEAPEAGFMPYIVAKDALEGFSRSLAMELAPKNIRVNLVSPGITDTGLIADMPEKMRLLAAAKTPLRRIALPEDVAAAVVFLASQDAGFITGQTLRVNGGKVMV